MKSKLFAVAISVLAFVVAFSGCTGSDSGSADMNSGYIDNSEVDDYGAMDNATENDTASEEVEEEKPKPVIETATAELTVTFGVQTYRLLKSDATFETKPNCLGIIARIDGSEAVPIGSSYTFEIWDSTFNTISGSGTRCGIIEGALPLEMRLPADSLKNYSGGDVFHVTLFCNDGAQIQGTYTAIIDMYYVAPLDMEG